MRMMHFMLALSVAVLPACSKEREETAARGALRLASAPPAEALVDGEVVGTTPVTYEGRPGPHEVILRTPAFRERKETIAVVAGHTRELEWVLTPTDPGDPIAVRRLAEAFGLDPVVLEPVERERGGRDSKRVVACYPRGDVRLVDLREFRVEVGYGFEPKGSLKFRRHRKDLHAAAFEPAKRNTVAAIPDAVLAALKPGAVVTWGYYPDKGRRATAKFKVVREDPRLVKRLKDLNKRLAGKRVLLLEMRAQLFLNKGLHMAAYTEARKAHEITKFAGHAVEIMESALQQMRLTRTALWEEVQQAAANAPPCPKGRGADGRRP